MRPELQRHLDMYHAIVARMRAQCPDVVPAVVTPRKRQDAAKVGTMMDIVIGVLPHSKEGAIGAKEVVERIRGLGLEVKNEGVISGVLNYGKKYGVRSFRVSKSLDEPMGNVRHRSTSVYYLDTESGNKE